MSLWQPLVVALGVVLALAAMLVYTQWQTNLLDRRSVQARPVRHPTRLAVAPDVPNRPNAVAPG